MSRLLVDIYSFGYLRSGPPPDETENNGGFVFDCRFLPNPGVQARFALHSGLDAAVREFLESKPEAITFMNHVIALIDAAIASYEARGYTHLHVAFGCTGGQHRSVFCAERLGAHLRENNIACNITHTERSMWT